MQSGAPQQLVPRTNQPSSVAAAPSQFAAAAKKRGRPVLGPAASSPPAKASDTMPAAAPARRKKKKISENDKQIPERVAAFIPESRMYAQLQEFEGKVDATLARKKLDIQEALRNPPRVARTLRVYIFNTHENQQNATGGTADATGARSTAAPPSWTLKIVGRVLDGEGDAAANATPKPQMPEFTSFFKKVTVQLDQKLYPTDHIVVWDSARAPSHLGGFEVRRRGSTEFVAKVMFEMNYMPERFRVGQKLAQLLGVDTETRPRIIAGIWQYIKAKKLQDAQDPTVFICDANLQQLFGESKVKFSTVATRIGAHLTPAGPILLEHNIRLTGKSPASDCCYDIAVDIPAPLQREMASFLTSIERSLEIDACDAAIREAITSINEHRRRRAFLLSFSANPTEFVNALIASQSRDLRVAAGDAPCGIDRERRSDFYGQPWVEDAVVKYLHRRSGDGGNKDNPG